MNIIRKFRNERGLTQTELASKIGVSRSTIAKYETGERIPSLLTLKKIADYLKIPLSELGINLPDGLKIITIEEAAIENFKDCVLGFGDASLVTSNLNTDSTQDKNSFNHIKTELNELKIKNMLIDVIIYFFNNQNIYPSFQQLENIEKEIEDFIIFKAFLLKKNENQEALILDKAINIANSKLSKTDIKDLNNLSEIEQKALLEKGLKIADKILKNKEEN